MSAREPIFEEAWDAFARHLPHHRAAPQTPATPPVNLVTAPAAASTTQEEHVSFITDVEQGYAVVKAEIGKLETALPGALAKAKAAESSPFALLVEKAASALLPPEAVAVAVKAADGVLNDLIALYQPAPPADAAPAPVPAGQ